MRYFFLLPVLLFSLQACSFSLVEEGGDENDTIVVEMPKEEREQITTLADAAMQAPKVETMNKGIQRSDQGRVEVFPLDMPTAEIGGFGQKVQTVKPKFEGGQSVNEQVQVYPFDPAFQVNPPLHTGRSNVPVPTSSQGRVRETLNFAHGSAHLDFEDLKAIQSLARQYKNSDAQKMTVTGHASREVNASSIEERKVKNLKMSMRRAVAAAEALITAGVAFDEIDVKAMGEAKPLNGRNGVSPEAASRRVEIRY